MATENIQHDFVFENNAKVFKCSIESCKHRKFATAWTLNRHMNMVHAKEFHCPIDDCFQVFDTRLALSKHKKKHKKISPAIDAIQPLLQKNIYKVINQDFMKKLKFQEIFVCSVKSN